MNEERFRKLARQAGVLIDWGEDIKVGRWGIGGNYKNMQKFAELIIRECVGIADDYVKDCTCEEHVNCKHPRSAIGRKIREQFGVEE